MFFFRKTAADYLKVVRCGTHIFRAIFLKLQNIHLIEKLSLIAFAKVHLGPCHHAMMTFCMVKMVWKILQKTPCAECLQNLLSIGVKIAPFSTKFRPRIKN